MEHAVTFVRPLTLFSVLLIVTMCALLYAISAGSANTTLSEALQALIDNTSGATNTLVLELRLPRALTAFAVGGLLSVAGVFMQVLLRNPLAEPYILGTSGGAAVCALSGMLLGWSAAAIDIAAFGGALGAALLVFGIAKSSGSWTPTRLLLTGVVLAAGFGALTTLLLALSPDQQLRGMLFWLMGDLSFAYSPGRLLLLLTIITTAGTLAARYFDVMALGELRAAALGVSVDALRMTIFATTALAVAMTVTAVGVIGFVGLVIPHVIRLVAGSGHRIVLPASALAGGALLTVADTLARSALSPRQLPVGAITAAIGVPLFLFIIRQRR